MLTRLVRRGVATTTRRYYGFEEEAEKKGKNFWQYARFTNVGGKTREEQGYQVSAQTKQREYELNKTPMSVNHWPEVNGSEGHRIMDYELNDNMPLGDIWEKKLEAIPKGEIRTRMIHVLRHFDKIDLRMLDWEGDLESDLGLDSLERIALITSVEHDFKIVFEDIYFDNIKSLDDMVTYLSQETSAY
jgi:acyl carrier protein